MVDEFDQAAQSYMAAQQPANVSQETNSQTVAPGTEGEQSIQKEAVAPVAEGEEQEVSDWNPQDFSFKADGKLRVPKTREELLQLASLGYHYNLRAQKLNQREAALYEREQALKAQPAQQSQPAPQQQQEELDFNPFAPVAPKDQNSTALEQRLAQLEQLMTTQTDKTNSDNATQYATQVEDFTGILAKDFAMSKEEIDEFVWDAMQVADNFQDMDDLKAYFYKTHPDAPEKRAKIIAEQDISKFKKQMSRNTVVNGTTVGNTPTTKAKIDGFDSAKNAAMRDPRFSTQRGIS